MDQSQVMYKVRPVLDLPGKIELPTCMYAMRSIADVNKTDRRSDINNEIMNNIMDKKPLPEFIALEARLDAVLEELYSLEALVKKLKTDIVPSMVSSGSGISLDNKELNNLKVIDGAVVNSSPLNPPYSLFLLKCLSNNSITFSSHVHSSVQTLPDDLKKYCESSTSPNSFKLVLIWKNGITDSELVINPVNQLAIRGEINILRHLGRMGLKVLQYPSNDAYQTVQIDSVLDVCHRLLHTQASKEKASLYRNLNSKLGKNTYFGGDKFNISDIAAWSILKQVGVNLTQDITPNMAKWYNKIDELLLC